MSILDLLIIILIVVWLGGFSFKVGGGLIHLLLVVAVVIFLARLLGVNI